jgi:hypothetical protein
VIQPWVQRVFSTGTVSLYEVERDETDFVPIVTPAQLPMGLGGAQFFGKGWGRPSGTPRTRSLQPGKTCLFIPLEQGTRLELELHVRSPHAYGQLVVEGSVAELDPSDVMVAVPVKIETDGRGLRRIDLSWTGSQELTVERIEVLTSKVISR